MASLANPEGVIQIPGVALLFALMLAAEPELLSFRGFKV